MILTKTFRVLPGNIVVNDWFVRMDFTMLQSTKLLLTRYMPFMNC